MVVINVFNFFLSLRRGDKELIHSGFFLAEGAADELILVEDKTLIVKFKRSENFFFRFITLISEGREQPPHKTSLPH